MTNKLNEKIADVENKIIVETKTDVEEPIKKDGRGRPRKTVKPEPEKMDINGLQFTSTIMDLLVKRMPNPLPLTNEEKSILDKLGDKVLNKYLDVNNFKYGEEVMLGGAVLLTIYPRIKKETKKDVGQNDNNTGRTGTKNK